MPLSRSIAATAAAVCVAAASALAFDPPAQPLQSRVAAADAVVLGVVRHVDYRMSTSTPTQPALPSTFVTVDVERVVRGQVAGPQLTLRFQGGLFPDGRFLDDPTAPLFDDGERVILLVGCDNTVDVPLVGWRYGRLRVIGARVYDDFGKPLSVADGRVTFGRAIWFPEVAQHSLGSLGRSFNPRTRELPAAGTQVGSEGVVGAPAADISSSLSDVLAWMRAIPTATAGCRVTGQDPNVPFGPNERPAVARNHAR
jgi:hypothetical protein